MESLASKKKTGLVILGLGAAAAALWYFSSQAEAAEAPNGKPQTLPPPDDYFPSGPTPSYSMPSDQTSSYDPYASSYDQQQAYRPSTTNYPNVPQQLTPSLPAYSPTPSATRGDSTIQLYQQRLSELGYDPGPIDGLYGSFTRRAVMDFQRDNNLTVDGILGPRTKAAIDAGTGVPAPTSGIVGRKTMHWRA